MPANSLVLGKHSGRHALALRYTELGYCLRPAEVDAAYQSFTELADRKKRIYDQDLIALLSSATRADWVPIGAVSEANEHAVVSA